MKSVFLALILVFAFSGLARAQSQLTVMDLIAQAQANNAALAVKVDATSAKVDKLGAVIDAQAAHVASMEAKLNQIHVAIVQNPALIPAPAAAVVVAPAGRSMAMQGPAGGIMMEQHGGMMGAGACSGGSCGSGGRTRMVARMRSR